MILKIFDKSSEGVEFAAGMWIKLHDDAVSKRGYFTASLSGGSTPTPLYQRLSIIEKTEFWQKTYLFQVDERYVPRDHPHNNFRMINEVMIRHVSINESNVFSVPVEKPIKESALEYEQSIRKFFHTRGVESPGFDLVLLGMGDDGHTASLFPGNEILMERDRNVKEVYLDNGNLNRITMTFRLINSSRNIIYLVFGKKKSNALKQVLEGEIGTLPSSMVKPKSGDLMFIADAGAASELSDLTRNRYQV